MQRHTLTRGIEQCGVCCRHEYLFMLWVTIQPVCGRSFETFHEVIHLLLECLLAFLSEFVNTSVRRDATTGVHFYRESILS